MIEPIIKEFKMTKTVNVKNIGLRGVTVADTKISHIDGENGILLYRGYRIEQLAQEASFMEVSFLVLNGHLPDREELDTFEEKVKAARKIPGYVLAALKNCPENADPMDVLQAAVPLLAMSDPDINDETREAHLQMAIRLISQIPLLIAGWCRIRAGLEILPSDNTLTHAENFLWLLHGKKPDKEMAADLDTCLSLHADHTFNASTFACREVVSTRAHMYAGITAGIGALSGSLHGGANAEVMKMLFELESEPNLSGWIQTKLDSGGKIMGLGHAIYKTIDPRARFLKDMAARTGKKMGLDKWRSLSMQIEKYAREEFIKRGKTDIQPNIDFYSAPFYHMMGIPLDIMTPIFCMARITGWCAHIIEEKFAEAQDKSALYRPAAEYVGRYCGLTGCTYEPIEAR